MENKLAFRPHITKEQRVPKSFKEVEKILQSVKSCKKNYKTILANSRLRGYSHKKVYSMTVNILKNYNYIQKIIDKTQLLEKEKYLRREMASILIYELIFGRGFLPGESKIVKTIQLYENDIFHAHEVLQNSLECSLSVDINIPRYVRVHTLVTTVPYVIKDLTSYGFHQVLYDDDLPEEKYFELVENLNKGCFLIDFHFKDVLVFERHENLLSLDLYKNGHIFLQDKASYIPVHVLNPEPGCAVLDACAAPGMKTVHIAAKMKNKGILIACERDKTRFECLKEMLNCGSVKICKTLCKDFKLLDPCDQAYSGVEYILLDPSCSGSGMVNRMDEVTDTENSKNMERLMKLAGFQIILLKHSLKFPSVKRVVYSTCSIHEEENEYVVHEALKSFDRTFKLIPAMPEWSHRGSDKFEFGKLCLRTDPKVHLTNGFFVAVFERIDSNSYTEDCFPNDQLNYQNHGQSNFKKQKKCFSNRAESYVKVDDEALDLYNTTEPENYVADFKHKHNITSSSKSHQMNEDENTASLNKNSESFENSIPNVNYESEQNLVCTQHKSKKHKKKKKNPDRNLYESNDLNHEIAEDCTLKCSESKKHLNFSFSKNNNNAISHTRKDKSEHDDHKNESTCENITIAKVHKKKKKKKKEPFEEGMLRPVEKCLSDYPENSSNVNSHKRKNKFKLNEHKDESTYENIATIEEITGDTKLHKKRKKKKKEHFESLTLQPEEKYPPKFHKQLNASFSENNNEAGSSRKDEPKQNEHWVENVNEDFAVTDEIAKLHKKRKKKRKEHIEEEMLQPVEECLPEFQEQPNVFSRENKIAVSKQDNNTFLPELEDICAENKTSSHKKKKR